MQVSFIFPDGLMFSVNPGIVPHYNEVIGVTEINDPSLFQPIEKLRAFENDHRLKTWKVNSVLYKLYPADSMPHFVYILQSLKDRRLKDIITIKVRDDLNINLTLLVIY